ncbi:hypothetical protein C6P45_001550 [Maudiozyma exigua]|uniref:Uncharacterized protein n=1 Tax=Maudiozyma exigua TaxID=34358 RepID=A0A9P6W0Y4_MAUEX|nr:hypothetical protein C6P45_001550 [Kazachstania exigua]
MNYGINQTADTDSPIEVAKTNIETNSTEFNKLGHVNNTAESTNVIDRISENSNEMVKEKVDAFNKAATTEGLKTINEYSESQTRKITNEAKSSEPQINYVSASATNNDNMTIHEYAEAQTSAANNGNVLEVNSGDDTRITEVNEKLAVKTNEVEAQSFNNETNLLFPNLNETHISFKNNTMHSLPEETKSATTTQLQEQQITIIDDDDDDDVEDKDTGKHTDTDNTTIANDYTLLTNTTEKNSDTGSTNDTEPINNPFINATEPTVVSSTKAEDDQTNNTSSYKPTNNVDPIERSENENQRNTIVITDTESSKEQSAYIDANINNTEMEDNSSISTNNKNLEEEGSPANTTDNKITEVEQAAQTDATVGNNEEVKNSLNTSVTAASEIANEDIPEDDTDKMDIDNVTELQEEVNKINVPENDNDNELENISQPDMASLSNFEQASDAKSFDPQTTESHPQAEEQITEETSIPDPVANDLTTTESNEDSEHNKETSKDKNNAVDKTQSDKEDVERKHEITKDQKSNTDHNKTMHIENQEYVSNELLLLKEQNKESSVRIESLTVQLDEMNLRCKVLEDELLKSNTTISESISSISILMQKFVKNQDTLKRELDTVKKSQLKIDVKNVKNVTKRTRREGMIMEEGDVEYRVVSRNLSNRRSVSRHDSNESRKRRHISTEAAEYIPESKARPSKPKPTKTQRIATEIFEKSQPAFGTVEKPAIDLASSLKLATTNDTIDFSKDKSPTNAVQSQLHSKTTAASMKLVRSKSGKGNVKVYEQVPSGPGIEYSGQMIGTSNHGNIVNLTGSSGYHKQLNSPQKGISPNLVESNHEKRILGQPPQIRRSSSSEALSSFIKPETGTEKIPTKGKQKIAGPEPAIESEDDYDPNMQFNDTAVDGNDDYVPQIGANEQEDNNVANTENSGTTDAATGNIPTSTSNTTASVTSSSAAAPTTSEQAQTILDEETEQPKKKPTVKGFKLVLAGKFRKSIQLYIVDDIIYTGESPYSAISFVYFVDLKYSNIRKTRETTTTNFSIGFPHILIDEGDKAMEVLGSNIMTPNYLMTVEYFLGDYLQACHLVEEKLSPGCTTDYWRRCRNLFLQLMYWRQLAREKRGFRRYTMLHAVKEIENFRLHVQPKSYAITEPFFLEKKIQAKIASSRKPKEWMFQTEKSLPVIGQNGITEVNINAALDALLKPPSNVTNFVPYASVAVPTGVEIV